MNMLQRILHDFDRPAFHYGIVTLYALFFQRVLPLIGLACIALGLLVAGYAFPDASGSQHRALRRVALAGTLSVLAIGLYIVAPVWLDSLGITPSPGHIRFYGMFFMPVGALAGVLAVLAGSWGRLAARAGTRGWLPALLSGYAIGFVVLWLIFLLYSRLMLGATMSVAFALIRATVTAALGAIFFALAPFLVRRVDRGPAQRLAALGLWAAGRGRHFPGAGAGDHAGAQPAGGCALNRWHLKLR